MLPANLQRPQTDSQEFVFEIHSRGSFNQLVKLLITQAYNLTKPSDNTNLHTLEYAFQDKDVHNYHWLNKYRSPITLAEKFIPVTLQPHDNEGKEQEYNSTHKDEDRWREFRP